MAQMSSGEAWIWYGHLNLPNNAGSFTTFTNPGSGTFASNLNNSDENNFYATQWILGRSANLLRAKDSTTGLITDRAGISQAFIDGKSLSAAGLTPVDFLAPLAHSSLAAPTNSSNYTMEQSRFDLAATSMDDYTQRLIAWSNYSSIAPMTTAGVDKNWWAELFCAPLVRFQGNPFLTPHPTVNSPKLNAFSFAQQAPIFLQGCTQFIVEYAGDFVCQDNNAFVGTTTTPNPNYGQVLNVYTNPNVSTLPSPTDGQVDFIVTTDANGNRSRKIRWYGLPRDVDGLDTTKTPFANTGFQDVKIPVNANPNLTCDVVPLRDIWRTSTIPPTAPYTNNAPFEKFKWSIPTGATSAVPTPPGTTTLKDVGAGGDYTASGTLGMGTLDSYTCAFGPNDPKPKMIRILLTIDDPNGKLTDGQTFEYVFTLP